MLFNKKKKKKIKKIKKKIKKIKKKIKKKIIPKKKN